jgi:hypothetical protein
MDKQATIPPEFWHYLLSTAAIGGGAGGMYGLYSMMRNLRNENKLGKLPHRERLGMPVNLLQSKSSEDKTEKQALGSGERTPLPWYETGVPGLATEILGKLPFGIGDRIGGTKKLEPWGTNEKVEGWDYAKPLAIGGGVGLGMGAFLAMRKLFERKKEEDIKRDVERARASFQDALIGKTAQDIASLRKQSYSTNRGVVPSLVSGGVTLAGIGALLSYLHTKGKLEKEDPQLNELKQLRRMQKRRAAINAPAPQVDIREIEGELVPSL